jgi:hypothetical protein
MRLPAWIALRSDPDAVFAGLDYVIAHAIKPVATATP